MGYLEAMVQDSKASEAAKAPGPNPRDAAHVEAPFDFNKHVNLSAEAISKIQIYSLTELGYHVQPGQVDFGYSDPFPFLTPEGLELYRRALTSSEVMQNCYFSSAIVPLVVRGAVKHSSFLRQMSTDKALLDAMRGIMQCGDLLQWHPWPSEQMHTNIQLIGAEKKPAFAWHQDSNDFVLLVQISDIPENAVGGGTLMMEKSGQVREVRAPAAGYAYLMQGKVLRHAANASENWIRCISVISFASKHTLAPESLEEDSVNLHLARNYTVHETLDKEFGTYRLENAMEKIQFLIQNYFDDSCDFGCKDRRSKLLHHLDHLVNNLQITRDNLSLLNEWSGSLPQPLPPDAVTDVGFPFAKEACGE